MEGYKSGNAGILTRVQEDSEIEVDEVAVEAEEEVLHEEQEVGVVVEVQEAGEEAQDREQKVAQRR